MANDGMVYLKNARADRGLSPDTSPPPSGLPRANSHTGAVGRWRDETILSGRLRIGARGDRKGRAILVPEQIAAFETPSGELATTTGQR